MLNDNNGKPDPNQVLKAVFKFGIGGFFGMTNLEREWRVGRQLALLSAPGEALPGFMGTGAGVVTKSGNFRGVLPLRLCITHQINFNLLLHACCAFAAMILERIVGRDITKPIVETGFHDVHYLRQMLFCTFKSLHQAQRKLAFHHADLRLANIMELMPEAERSSHGKHGAVTRTTTPKSARLQDAALSDLHFASDVIDPADTGAVDLQKAARAHEQTSGGNSNLREDAAVQYQDTVFQHSVDAHDLAGYQSGGEHHHIGGQQRDFKASQLHVVFSWETMRINVAHFFAKQLPMSFIFVVVTHVLTHSKSVQMIDFGLADFREVFGAGYVMGKRTLIHNEPHHAQQPHHTDSKNQAHGEPQEVTGEGRPGGRHVPFRGNKGIEKRSDAVPSGHKGTKFFPTPSHLLPQVNYVSLSGVIRPGSTLCILLRCKCPLLVQCM